MARSSQAYYTNNTAHANRAVGSIYLDQLRPVDFRQWLADAKRPGYNGRKNGYAEATLAGWHRAVTQILDEAVEDGLIDSNPAKFRHTRRQGGRQRRRTKGARGRRLTREQFLTLLHHIETSPCSEDIRRLLLAIAWTGCRIGELLALHWDDYRDGELFFTKSVSRGELEYRTKTGEDEDNPRVIWVVPPLAEVLELQRRWLLTTQHPALKTGLIFPARPQQALAGARRRGAEIRWFRAPTAARKVLDKVIKQAGLPRVVPQSLRRTLENLDRGAGNEPLVRRASRGWVTEAAQEIYSQVDRGDREAQGDALMLYLFGPDEAPDEAPATETANRGTSR
ncbi:MAG: tyrosine-type recombinase/integrase [Deltaproteobacteria bacterium]|nr:tyrosine-type recombinase/integrase [Deltaproteobacteria bacterium]